MVDLDGAFVVPGLINAHVHLGLLHSSEPPDASLAARALRMAANAEAALRAGVTTVRLCGEQDGTDLALRDAILMGRAAGPRIVTACAMLHPGSCAGRDGFLREARAQLARGADLVKVYISESIGGRADLASVLVEPDELEAVVRVAHASGKPVAVHAGPPEAIGPAVELGVDSVEHGYALDPGGAAAMARRGTWLVPTLGVTGLEAYYVRKGVARRVIDRALAAADGHRVGFRAALDHGVRIALGTDLLPGEPVDGTSATVREIELMVEAGMPPARALRAATSDAAELLGVDAGSVEEGKAADLIATVADPVADVSALRELRLVMRAGTRYV